ncbi:hypothetical protein ABZP36_006695 [Zizania latifolia]
MVETWDASSFSYHECNIISAAAAFVDPNAAYAAQTRRQPKSARFKQEAELDAAAVLHFSSHLAELPQLESPSAPLPPNPSQLATAKEDDDAVDAGRRAKNACAGDKVTTDWRALDKFVASQLSPGECAAAAAGVSSQLDHGEDDDMAALLFLKSYERDEVERWTGLLGSAGASGDGDLGICKFEK